MRKYRCLSILFALLVLIPSISAQPDSPTYLPDRDVPTTDDELGNVVVPHSSDANERFLSRVGLPFFLQLGSKESIAQVTEAVLLAQPNGICRPIESTALLFYFSLYPEHLDALYGVERIELLRAVQPPRYWELVSRTWEWSEEKFAAEKRFLEEWDLQRNLVGMIPVRFVLSWTGANSKIEDTLVFLNELGTKAQKNSLGSMFELEIKSSASSIRAVRKGFIESRLQYADHIANYDSYVHNVTQVKLRQLKDAVQATVSEFLNKRTLRLHYEEYKKQRQDPTTLETIKRATVLTEPPVQPRWCEHLQEALKTLKSAQRESGDSRLHKLTRLFTLHGCHYESTEQGLPPSSSGGRIVQEICTTWEEENQRLHVLQRRISPAEVLTMLHHSYRQIYPSTGDGFDAQSFYDFLVSLTDSNGLMECPCCVKSTVVAEIYNAVALVHFMASPAANNNGEITCRSTTVGCRVKALVALQQSLWAGSTNAAAYLNVLYSNGIVVRKNRVIAAQLALAISAEADTYLYRLLKRALERNTTLPAEELLRFVRPYQNHYSWHRMNGHLITQDTVSSFYVYDDPEAEDEEGHGTNDIYAEQFDERSTYGHTAKLANRALQAYFHAVGLRKEKNRFTKATCKYFIVLRQMGYICDAIHGNSDEVDDPSMYELGDLCPEHDKEFKTLAQSYKYRRLLCSSVNFTEHPVSLLKGSYAPTHFYTPPRIGQYNLLQEVIIGIGYVYLWNGQQYDRSSRYAAESIKLSYKSYRVGVHLRYCRNESYWLTNPAVKPDRACRIDCKNHWTCAKFILPKIPWNTTNVTLPNPLDTSFFNREAFLLLAIALLHTPQGHERFDAVQQSAEEVLTLFGIEGGKVSSDYQALFLVYAAMRNIDSYTYADRLSKSPARPDPFFLLSWLLDLVNEEGHYRFSLSQIRELGTTLCRALVGEELPLPYLQESRVAFQERVLRTVMKKTNAYRTQLALRQLRSRQSPHYITPEDAAISKKPNAISHYAKIHQHGASPKENMVPLLYFTDVNDYLEEGTKTTLQRYFYKFLNTLYYPFTETLDETYARELASSVHPADTDTGEYPANEELPPFLNTFTAEFLSDVGFRRFAIAFQLMVNALFFDSTQGMSLLLREATSNPLLRPFADYLASGVWSPTVVATMWYDQYLNAQLNIVKPKTRVYSIIYLSSEQPIPYPTTKSEPRQELASALSRWQASTTAAKTLDPSVSPEEKSRLVQKAKDMLSVCVGYLYYASTKRNRKVNPTRLYDGMTYPAGDVECAKELYRLMQQTETPASERYYLLQVLEELNRKKGVYYNLWEDVNATTSKDDDDDDDDGWTLFRVEPWNSLSDEEREFTRNLLHLKVGEGKYFYKRLQTVSGVRYGTKLLRWWNWLQRWVPL